MTYPKQSGSQDFKQQTLEKLKLIADEPNLVSEYFRFKSHSDKIMKIITDKQTPTPFSIAVHGKWGEGKTSLIKRAYDIMQEKEKKENFRIVWFDAWEYERLDPTAALLSKIAQKFDNKSKQFRDAVEGIIYLFSDIALRATIGMEINEFTSHFNKSVRQIETITTELEKMIEGYRLVVFVDDLDRCLVENALKILEAIKMFLNAKGSIFVIAVDMDKIETAWMLRHGGLLAAKDEGREHTEKIFQLKLSLPPKDDADFVNYINDLASSLPDKERKLLIDGCSRNPRKAKKILNSLYFNAQDINSEEFEKKFPLLLIWIICSTSFPKLSKLVRINPSSIIQMAYFAYRLETVDRLKQYIPKIKATMINDTQEVSFDQVSFHGYNFIPTAIEGLEFAANEDEYAFMFLKAIGRYYELKEPVHKAQEYLGKQYAELGEGLRHVIFYTGLV